VKDRANPSFELSGDFRKEVEKGDDLMIEVYKNGHHLTTRYRTGVPPRLYSEHTILSRIPWISALDVCVIRAGLPRGQAWSLLRLPLVRHRMLQVLLPVLKIIRIIRTHNYLFGSCSEIILRISRLVCP